MIHQKLVYGSRTSPSWAVGVTEELCARAPSCHRCPLMCPYVKFERFGK